MILTRSSLLPCIAESVADGLSALLGNFQLEM